MSNRKKVEVDQHYQHPEYGMGTVQRPFGPGKFVVDFVDMNVPNKGLNGIFDEIWILENCTPVSDADYSEWYDNWREQNFGPEMSPVDAEAFFNSFTNPYVDSGGYNQYDDDYDYYYDDELVDDDDQPDNNDPFAFTEDDYIDRFERSGFDLTRNAVDRLKAFFTIRSKLNSAANNKTRCNMLVECHGKADNLPELIVNGLFDNGQAVFFVPAALLPEKLSQNNGALIVYDCDKTTDIDKWLKLADAASRTDCSVIAIGDSDFAKAVDANKKLRLFFSFHVTLTKPETNKYTEMAHAVFARLEHPCAPAFEDKLIDYIEAEFKHSRLNTDEFIMDTVNKVNLKYIRYDSTEYTAKHVPDFRWNSAKVLLDRLNDLAGVENAKKVFNEIYEHSADKNLIRPLNFVFVGPDGAGQDKVADIAYDLLKALELSDSVCIKNHNRYPFKYEDGPDTYIVKSSRKSFNSTFITEPENAVHFPRKYIIDFEEYTNEEMLKIFNKLCARDKLKLAKGAEETLLKMFDEEKADPFFNGDAGIKVIYNTVKGVWAYSKNADERVLTAKMIEACCPKVKWGIDFKDMIGIENIQAQFDDFVKNATYMAHLKKMDVDPQIGHMHMVFQGSPGTGKTTVAEQVAKFLSGKCGLLKKPKVVSVSRKDLVAEYIGQTAPKTAEVIERALGGVLFIDEAYSLAPGDFVNTRDFGHEAVEELIIAMEKYKDKLVVIFAGYTDEMRHFLNINPGLRSRIGYTFTFPDYTEDQLTAMFIQKAKKSGLQLADDVENKVKEVIHDARNMPDFGNGRFVDQLFHKTVMQRANRPFMKKEDKPKELCAIDVPATEDLLRNSGTPNAEVDDSDIFWPEGVREELNNLVEEAAFFKEHKKNHPDAKIPEPNLHMIFQGNPGSGKTTIARYVANFLYQKKILKSNNYVSAERKDLVGEYVGETAQKTDDIIKKALNGVLFIDEAYSLTPKEEGKDFGHEAIETLITAMEKYKGNLVVIFAGYTDEMRRFMDSNPGIRSRIGYTFTFPDFSDDQIAEMFKTRAGKSCLRLAAGVEDKVKEVTESFRNTPDFGNGRFVEKLFNLTVINRSKRPYAKKKDKPEEILPRDVPSAEDLLKYSGTPIPEGDEKNIKWPKDVKNMVDGFVNVVAFKKALRESKPESKLPEPNLHMIFQGNPGSGKTTIAKYVANLLYKKKILKSNNYVSAERKDLVGTHIGQTAPKTADIIKKALNGVLFIDEAYSLVPNDNARDFGQEAIATLITAMEAHKGNLVVIFAGYPNEMQRFRDSNPGIDSRIGFTLDFPDYDTEDLWEIFVLNMNRYKLEYDEDVEKKIKEIFDFFKDQPRFGNGRFVDKVIDAMISKRSERYAQGEDTQLDRFTAADVPEVKEMIAVNANKALMVTDKDVSEAERERLAVHEAGHALVGMILRPDIMPKLATISANAVSLAHVEFDEDNTINKTETDCKFIIAKKFGGRNAERLIYGDNSTGCENDMQTARLIAASMAERYGMGEIGVTTENDILQEADRIATKVLSENREILMRIANTLKEKGSMTGEELKDAMK